MDQSGYSFSSEPRAVKTKYRDGDDPASKNIHTYPRVARGKAVALAKNVTSTSNFRM
jgi:hypothetical protein